MIGSHASTRLSRLRAMLSMSSTESKFREKQRQARRLERDERQLRRKEEKRLRKLERRPMPDRQR